MRAALLLLIPLAGFTIEALAIDPHPDAIPNGHEPGEVDIEANLKYIISSPTELEGIVLDETDATLVGDWQYSTHTPPYVGIGYLHDMKSGKGEKSLTWNPQLTEAGNYEVRVSHCYNVRRATNSLVVIHHADGISHIRINQQEVPEHGHLFRSLGTFRFEKGKSGKVVIRNDDTAENKVVIADAVQFIKVKEVKPSDSRD
jgi:hypothetical protein